MPYCVGLTYDLHSDHKISPKAPADSNCELDSQKTIDNIIKAFRDFNLDPILIGGAAQLLKGMPKGCDVIFNISEGMHGRNREAWAPILLEMSGMPYVGSDPLSLSLSLDKYLTKKLFQYHSIPTPNFIKVNSPEDTDEVGDEFPLSFPVIAKLNNEGSSKGLSPDSIVYNKKNLIKQLEFLTENYRQPVLIEEFIEGRELTAAIIGIPPRVIGVVERHVDKNTGLGSPVFTARRGITFKDEPQYLPASYIPEGLEKEISEIAVKAFNALECRDMARVDFRVAPFRGGFAPPSGKVYALEINPLPSFAQDDTFYLLSEFLGWGFSRMIIEILNCALKRNNMKEVAIGSTLSLDSV